MLWYGSVADIPSGWAFCDGSLGTPDLRNKFVQGAGTLFPAPGTTGGSITHQHDFEGDGHAHDLAIGTNVINSAPDGDYHHTTSSSPASGTTDTADGRPLYHTLCYIMKLPIP